MGEQHRVVIVGGGFAGLEATRALRRASAQITLIDRRNFHLFQPLLYQVATGGLSPANIASPLRGILKHQRNVRVLQAEVVDFDVNDKEVVLLKGRIAYDTLLIATGSTHHYFGHDQWERFAPGLKTVEDALQIRRRVLSAFEAAERESSPSVRESLLTFLIVGGGPTGVELAGALAEMAHHTLRKEFREIDTADSRIIVCEAADRLLTGFPESLSLSARQSLEKLGVTVRLKTTVEDMDEERVVLSCDGSSESVDCRTILWGAGVRASGLGAKIASATGATTDRAGRVVVHDDLSIPGHPDIFVIGDLAAVTGDNGKPLPGVAPVAMQQGKYVGRLIRDRIRGKSPNRPFRYRDLGNMAVIGRAAAVAQMGRFQMSGILAWMSWLFIHLINLVAFQNRILVLIQWAWNYLTRNRSARLITHEEKLPERSAATRQPD